MDVAMYATVLRLDKADDAVAQLHARSIQLLHHSKSADLQENRLCVFFKTSDFPLIGCAASLGVPPLAYA